MSNYETKPKRKKRVMKEFRIDEISAVDRPAMAGARALIMKRDSSESIVVKNGDLVNLLTSSNEGHQHGIRVWQDEGRPFVSISYARTDDEDGGHDHLISMAPDGTVSVSENAGHSHTIDSTAFHSLLMQSMIGKGSAVTEVADLSIVDAITGVEIAKAAIAPKIARGARALTLDKNLGDDLAHQANAADNGGGAELGETTMTQTTKAAEHIAAENEVANLKVQLAKAQAMASLSDAQKVYYNTLSEVDRAGFIGKSAAARDADLELAKAANPVVHTAEDGTVYRKSDDPRLIAMAKQGDLDRAELKKMQEQAVENTMRKRAETELSCLPGTVDTHVAILKAVDSIADEATRDEAMKVLKAQNASMSKAFIVHGTKLNKNDAGDSASAVAELDSLAKAHQKDKGVDYYTAYSVVSEANPELYQRALTA